MAPKEKARELVNKFIEIVYSPNNLEHIIAKDCAIIAIDEMLKVISTGSHNENFYNEVKNELNKL